jgi:hypothetical protein
MSLVRAAAILIAHLPVPSGTAWRFPMLPALRPLESGPLVFLNKNIDPARARPTCAKRATSTGQ